MIGNSYHPEPKEAQQEVFLAHVITEAGRLGMSLADLADRLVEHGPPMTRAEEATEATNRG